MHLPPNDVLMSESGHSNAECQQVSYQTLTSDFLTSHSTAQSKSEPNPLYKITYALNESLNHLRHGIAVSLIFQKPDQLYL